MQLLMQAIRRCARLAALLLAASVAGCFLLRGSGERPLAFSHARHVGEEQLECINCHEDASVSDEPGMPAPDACRSCHAAIDPEKPPERRVATLFDGDVLRATRASRLGEELRFSHLRHVQAGLDCAACHRGIAASESVGPELALRMADCTACHAGAGVSPDCATCHREVRRDAPPATHALDWRRRHGRVFRAGTSGTANRCELCHTEDACARCHAIEPPASHDEHWRLRGHGVHARIDRESCAACHQPYDCQRCHATTPPRNHTSGFGEPRDRHCLVCHQPLGATDCVTCHQGTPSHARAAPKPSWHSPAMNCRQCHGVQLPLPHVDDGDDCNLCHR